MARIFSEFLSYRDLLTIAEGLTRDGIASPSAHDRARNSRSSGIALSKSAVRAILTNPRYAGRQVWNRQRKDEALLDVVDAIRLAGPLLTPGETPALSPAGSPRPKPSAPGSRRSSAPRRRRSRRR